MPPATVDVLGALSRGVILAWGWPRRLIAFSAGAVGAMALPPFGFAPALLVPMMTAVWLIDGAADRVVLRVSHTGMLFSAKVAGAAGTFLRTGRF